MTYEPLQSLNREFDYHRIQGSDEKYRENFDAIFRKELTPTGESEKPVPQSSRASDASVIREGLTTG